MVAGVPLTQQLNQRLGPIGFGQIVVHAAIEKRFLVDFTGIGRQRNQHGALGLLAGFLVAPAARHLEAAHVGHVDIQQHQVEGLALLLLQRLVAAGHAGDDTALFFQHLTRQHAIDRPVVDDQHAQRHDRVGQMLFVRGGPLAVVDQAADQQADIGHAIVQDGQAFVVEAAPGNFQVAGQLIQQRFQLALQQGQVARLQARVLAGPLAGRHQIAQLRQALRGRHEAQQLVGRRLQPLHAQAVPAPFDIAQAHLLQAAVRPVMGLAVVQRIAPAQGLDALAQQLLHGQVGVDDLLMMKQQRRTRRRGH